MAKDEPPGTYPKYFYGKQTYWTVIGVNGDSEKALLNEEGMLEVGRGAFSLEPFLYLNGKLITWNAVHTTQSLEDGYLPIPSVTLGLRRPRLHRHGVRRRRARVVDAVRRLPGRERRRGAPARQLLPRHPALSGEPAVAVAQHGRRSGADPRHRPARPRRARQRRRTVVSLPAPDHFGAATFEQGPVTDFLAKGEVPPRAEVSDPLGFAGGALQYSIDLQPGEAKEVHVAVPFHDSAAMDEAARVDLVAKLDDSAARDQGLLAIRPRPRRLRGARRRREARPDPAHQPRLRSDQPQRRRPAARPPQLRALLDSRRRADLGGPARDRLHRGGARVHALVRHLPVSGRQGSVLHRPPRRRPGGRERQQRRVHVTRWPSTTATRTTSASSARCGRAWCGRSSTSPRCGRSA